jgi:hypothetical protein
VLSFVLSSSSFVFFSSLHIYFSLYLSTRHFIFLHLIFHFVPFLTYTYRHFLQNRVHNLLATGYRCHFSNFSFIKKKHNYTRTYTFISILCRNVLYFLSFYIFSKLTLVFKVIHLTIYHLKMTIYLQVLLNL